MTTANYKKIDQSIIACLPADIYRKRKNGKIRYREKEKKRKDENNNNNKMYQKINIKEENNHPI